MIMVIDIDKIKKLKLWESALPTDIFQNLNPTNGLDTRVQNIDQVRLRNSTANFNSHHLEKDWEMQFWQSFKYKFVGSRHRKALHNLCQRVSHWVAFLALYEDKFLSKIKLKLKLLSQKLAEQLPIKLYS